MPQLWPKQSGSQAGYCATLSMPRSALGSGRESFSTAASMASCIFYGAESSVQGRDLDGAIKECQQALTLEPDSSYLPYLHLQIARLFLEKGDFVHAIPEYRTAVQLHPKRRKLPN